MGFLGVRIDQDLEEKIRATGRSRSEVVRAALRAYFEADRAQLRQDQEVLIREIERLLDEKILVLNTVKQPPLNTVKPKQAQLNTVKQPLLNTVKPKQRPLNAVKHRPSSQADEIIVKAAQAILACFDEGREPLNTEIAEAVGVSVNSLGMYLRPTGIKTTPTGRQGIKGRYFTFDLKERIEEILATGELEGEGGD